MAISGDADRTYGTATRGSLPGVDRDHCRNRGKVWKRKDLIWQEAK